MAEQKEDCKPKKNYNNYGASSVVYCFGIIGAAIYFIQYADTFWIGVLGILKALIWPVFLVYKLLEYFGM